MDLAAASAAYVGERPVRRILLGRTSLWPPPTRSCSVDDLVYSQYGAPLRPDHDFPGWGAHEAVLGGVNRSFDWAVGGRPGPRPHHRWEGAVYTHHNVWGQVTPAAGGSPERRVRVEVETPRVYHLGRHSRRWVQVRGTAADVKNFEGGYWTGQWFSKTRDMRGREVRTERFGHSWSALPLTRRSGAPSRSCIGHWSYSGFYPRLSIPAGGRVAIFTRMRIAPLVPGADVDRARFLGAISGDLYTSRWAAVGRNGRNPPLAIPRHQLLTSSWQPFSYVSAGPDEIRSLPPLPFLDD